MSGQPVVRPLWWEFPDNKDTWAAEESLMLGPALLVHPVMKVCCLLLGGGGCRWSGSHEVEC